MLQGWGVHDLKATNTRAKEEWKETFLYSAAGNAMCGFVLADVIMAVLTYGDWDCCFKTYSSRATRFQED
jgi:hypothetical protein